MKYMPIAGFAVIIMICAPVCAEENAVKTENKPAGVEVVPDTAVTVIKKVNAFFAGNLEWTMPPGKDKYREDYTVDPLGIRHPCSTLKKYDSGVR